MKFGHSIIQHEFVFVRQKEFATLLRQEKGDAAVPKTYFPAFVRLPNHIPDGRIIDLIHPFNLQNARSFGPFKTVADVHTQKLKNSTRMYGNNV